MDSGKSEHNFSKAIKHIISKYEQSSRRTVSVIELSDEEHVEKRRLYDLFSIFCALGICRRDTSKIIIWEGLKAMKNQLIVSYENVEKVAMTTDILNIFNPSDSPAIGVLAINLVLIYFFFGESELTLKQICFIMNQKRSSSHKLLRRLYLAAFCLEQIGLIARSKKTGSYKILLDTDGIVSTAFNNLHKQNVFPKDSVPSLMKKIDKSYYLSLQKERREYLLLNFDALDSNGEEDIRYDHPSKFKKQINQKLGSCISSHPGYVFQPIIEIY